MIMKNQLLNLKMIALMCLMMVLGGANVWAEQYKIVFAKGTSDNSTAMTKTTSKSDVISSGVEYVASFNTCINVFNKSKNGLKIGKGAKKNDNGSGTIEFSIADGYQKNIKKITIKSAKWVNNQDKSDTGTLTLYNGTTSLKSGITPGTDYTHTFDAPATVSSIKLSTSAKRAYISEIILETAESNNPTLVASESALDFGSVENNTSKDLTFKLSGSKLTADATLSVAGDYFTVTPTSVAQTDGTIPETDVTVSYNPTAVGSHTATLTISSTGAEAKTITLKGTSANAYTVAWNVNGNVYTDGTPTTKVFEGEKVSVLPTTPESINGKVFVGWTNATLSATQAAAPSVLFKDATDAPKVTGDVTYYAVFADVKNTGTIETILLQTLKYDTWTYNGTTTDKSTYRFFGSNSYVESESFDLSTLSKVVVYGGTYGGDKFNKLTIGDGVNIWKEVTVTGKSETGVNTFENGTPLSGNGKLKVISNSGDGSNNGVRISKIEIYTNQPVVTYSGYCTTVAAEPVQPTSVTIDFKAQDGDGFYYATFSSDKDVVFNQKSVDVFAVSVSNEKVDTKILDAASYNVTNATVGSIEKGYYVPANTGVLIVGYDATTTYYFPAEAQTVTLPANQLKPAPANGGVFEETADYKYYKLAYGNWTNKTQLGFYWGAPEGGKFFVKAGTAYLAVRATETTAKGFTLNGEATGIEGVNANVENAKAIYNLNGQRVASMAKPGLYIVNGKKVVRK